MLGLQVAFKPSRIPTRPKWICHVKLKLQFDLTNVEPSSCNQTLKNSNQFTKLDAMMIFKFQYDLTKFWAFKLQSNLIKTSHCSGNQTWLNVDEQAIIKPN
jgi:hypothetical protein